MVRHHVGTGDPSLPEPPLDVETTHVRWPAEESGEVVTFLLHCGPAAGVTRP